MNTNDPVRLFGPGLIVDQRGEAIAMRSRKQLALLAYLAVEHQTVHSREALMALFWPDEDTPSAQNNLRVTLSRVRELAEKIGAYADNDSRPELLLIDRRTVQFHPAWVDHIDVNRFNQLLERTHQHTHTHRSQCQHCQPLLMEMVQRYQGDFLSGFGLNDCSTFEEWVAMQRERLRVQVIEAYADLATYAEDIGDLSTASDYAQRQIELDSLRESAHRQHMRILAKQGQRNAALAAFERCRVVLRETLGIEPEPETQALYRQILQSVPRQQLADTPPRRHNLPTPLTRFIGREQDIAVLARQMTDTHTRLVTLTGSGGVGKTRLALRVAHEVSGLAPGMPSFPDGVWLAELAALTDELSVTRAMLSVLGMREQPGVPLAQTLSESIRDKHLLLIFDNCEHLLVACATLITQLLASAPKLTVLATSRSPLRIAGESVYRVPSLPLPTHGSEAHRPPETVEATLAYEAVQLFVDRATAVNPQFVLQHANVQAVIQICQRLDGIPLALELAAARVSVMPVEVIAQRLDSRFKLLTSGNPASLPRHRTLHALVDWSYDLLSNTEQALLRQLSVFTGGWTLETAEAVCEPGDDAAVLDCLVRLVDHSLVVFGYDADHKRYTLLETIRQYAQEQLQLRGEEHTVSARHAHFYTQFVAQAAAQANSPTHQHGLSAVEAEYANVFAALAWAIEHDIDLALSLASSLGGAFQFWEMRGHFEEGRRWLEQLLAATEDKPSPTRAKIMLDAAWVERARPNYPQSLAYTEASVKLYDELGDALGGLDARLTLASTTQLIGQTERGLAMVQTCLEMAERLGHKQSIGRAVALLAFTHLDKNEHEPAKQLVERALSVFRETGDTLRQAEMLGSLAIILDIQGEDLKALAIYEELVATRRASGYRRSLALAQNNMGYLLIKMGHYERAREQFVEGLLIRREMGLRLGYVYSFSNFGVLAARENKPARAAQLFGAAEALCELIGFPTTEFAQDSFDDVTSFVRAALGEARFSQEWARGRGLTAEQAIELALEES